MLKFSDTCLILFFLILALTVKAQQLSEFIKVNQVGYLTNESKYAYVSSEQQQTIGAWHVYDLDKSSIAYVGSGYNSVVEDIPTEEFVYELDFSTVTDLGNYYVVVDGIGKSHDFLISPTVYNEVFRKIMKGFYYQRSGVELPVNHASIWKRSAEYDEDAFIYKGYDASEVIAGDHVEVAGGWRDAGDPNKKVVPAAIAVHQLMMLVEHFPDRVSAANWNIPNDADFMMLPDVYTEIKVCIDWLLKMQRGDGAVWHAVTQEDFYLQGMGHQDPNPRYLMPVSTTATASLAAALAQASRVFENIDAPYADQCLASANKAWTALNNSSIWNNPTIKGANGNLQYPEPNGYSVDPPGINLTANYEDTDDTDERYWAAIELFLATQGSEFYDFVEDNLVTGIYYPSLWSAVANMADFSFVMGMKDTNDPLFNTLKNSIEVYADLYVARGDTIGFGMALTAADYYWGSNNLVGQFAYTMILAYEITGNANYKKQALHHLSYLLGSNSLNQTFISDVGDEPVEAIFHLPSLYDGVNQVVPGLIPGGPNQYLVPTDIPHANLINTQDPSPAKSYIDSEYSFASNETTILESAGWAFVSGYFYKEQLECNVGNLTNTWIGPAAGDWHASVANWSLLEFPSTCHKIIIPDNKVITIGVGQQVKCLSIEVADGGGLQIANTAIVESSMN